MPVPPTHLAAYDALLGVTRNAFSSTSVIFINLKSNMSLEVK